MSQNLHYRRCHICGHLNLKTTEKVSQCVGCRRSLAPFYYFDDKDSEVPEDIGLRADGPGGDYAPIYGLTVHWEEC